MKLSSGGGKKYLFFHDGAIESIENAVRSLSSQGLKEFSLFPAGEKATALQSRLHGTSGIGVRITPGPKPSDADAWVHLGHEGGGVSEWLLDCLDCPQGVVLAPVTDEHITRRPVYLISIPKAGTHLMIRLLDVMGIERNLRREPAPGKWHTIDEYNYHASCRDFLALDWTKDIGSHHFFRSPAIFVYRNPLDIVISELNWFQKSGVAFGQYLEGVDDTDEKLNCMIHDPFVLGTIRDRVNRFLGWLNFPNVIPVSYEELVGKDGGGILEDQIRSIWSLQLKLHIPGCPEDYGYRIYDPASPTFRVGQIAQHKAHFKEEHYRRFRALPGDFMEKLGYEEGQLLPKFIERYRKTPLRVAALNEHDLWGQRLVCEDYHNYNIIYTCGQYVAVHVALGPIDISVEENRKKNGVYTGLRSLEEAKSLIQTQIAIRRIARVEERIDGLDAKIPRVEERIDGLAGKAAWGDASPQPMLIEAYHGYNIVQLGTRFCGVSQGLGSLDLAGTDAMRALDLEREGLCLTGDSVYDVRYLIDDALRLSLEENLRNIEMRLDDVTAELNAIKSRRSFRIVNTLSKIFRA